MERRFGFDFGRVKVHDDSKAAASAQAVNALAYTVGTHVVFNSGAYAPQTKAGWQLLAHELTHVIQQRGRDSLPGQPLAIDPFPALELEAVANELPGEGERGDLGTTGPETVLQRACISGDACKGEVGQGAKTTATLADPQNASRRERRRKLCGKRPMDPACTNDGHSRRAFAVETFLSNHDPTRLSLIHGVFIDKDIPAEWGAYHKQCNHFVPAIDGEQSCVFVPDSMEEGARQFNTTADETVGGMPREDWHRLNLRILMHETGHARFRGIVPNAPRKGACAVADIWSELQEIAADLDECLALYELLGRSNMGPVARWDEIERILEDRWVGRAVDNWLKIRCVCDCPDAESYLRRTVETMSVDWDISLKVHYHDAIRARDSSWPLNPKPFGMGDFPQPRGGSRVT